MSELELSDRERLLERALSEVLDLFEFTSPISIEAYDKEGVLDWFELTEEAADVVQRAELILGFEEDEDECSSHIS